MKIGKYDFKPTGMSVPLLSLRIPFTRLRVELTRVLVENASEDEVQKELVVQAYKEPLK